MDPLGSPRGSTIYIGSVVQAPSADNNYITLRPQFEPCLRSRSRDCVVFFKGDTQTVAVDPAMVSGGWPGVRACSG